MPQIFFNMSDITGDNKYRIVGQDYGHLTRVRRVQQGQVLQLRSDTGDLYNASIEEITNESIMVSLLDRIAHAEPEKKLRLYCAVIKGKNFDITVQKATEVGVTEIIPVITERTIPDIEQKQQKKLERWNRIAHEASKQSLRSSVPIIHCPCLWTHVCSVPENDLNILAHPEAECHARQYLSTRKGYDRVNVLIGPEGGFSDTEIGQATEGGWHSLCFGPTVLRAETAAAVIPALVLYELSNGN